MVLCDTAHGVALYWCCTQRGWLKGSLTAGFACAQIQVPLPGTGGFETQSIDFLDLINQVGSLAGSS